MNNTILFQEEQRFTNNKFLWIVVISVLIFQYGLAFLGDTQTNEPEKAIFITNIVSLGILSLLAALYFFKMKTIVYADRVEYGFPFIKNSLDKKEIETAQNIQYKPLLEWGGWGIRMRGIDRAYNVCGNKGIQLTLTDGKVILLGSQKPNQLHEAIIVHK